MEIFDILQKILTVNHGIRSESSLCQLSKNIAFWSIDVKLFETLTLELHEDNRNQMQILLKKLTIQHLKKYKPKQSIKIDKMS